MKKNIKNTERINIQPKKDQVRIKRNFIEQSILDIKHYIQKNSALVFKWTVLVVGAFFLIIVFSSYASWVDRSSFQKLYQSRKELNKALQEYKYLDLIKNSMKGLNAGQKKEDDFTKKTRKEADERFLKAVKELNALNSIFFSFLTDASNLAVYEIGLAYFKRKENDKAIQYLTKFVGKSKGHFLSIHSYEMIAYCYEKKAEYDKALHAFEQLFKNYKDSYILPKVLYSIGRLYEKKGNTKKAAMNYKKVLKEFKDQSVYYVRLARKRLYLLNLKKT